MSAVRGGGSLRPACCLTRLEGSVYVLPLCRTWRRIHSCATETSTNGEGQGHRTRHLETVVAAKTLIRAKTPAIIKQHHARPRCMKGRIETSAPISSPTGRYLMGQPRSV